MTTPTILTSAADFLADYDVLLCDVWGVLHDGRKAYAGANECLPKYRARGGTVVLVSNAPMTGAAIGELLDDKGVSRACWDEIIGSGDIALTRLKEQGYQRIYGIGPRNRDRSFFERVPRLVDDLGQADAVACTGLTDDRTEKPEQYRALLAEARARKLPFVCANPDLAVHVGHDLLPCAGALAAIYEEMGGDVFWCGKPHPSAYGTGLKVAERLLSKAIDRRRVLGIGDAVRTDLASAAGAGVDGLFIGQGLHRDELLVDGQIDPQKLAHVLKAAKAPPKATMLGLSW